jgi:hypothetical protein
MTIIPLNAGRLTTRARHNLHLHPEPRKHAMPPFIQPYAGLSVDSYAVVNGYPADDPGYGISSASFASADQVTVGAGSPGVLAVAVGSTARWIPSGTYMDANTWWPVGGSASTYPRILRTGLGAAVDPVLDPAYSYLQGKDRVTYPAMDFNGAGYGQIQPAASPAASSPGTFMWVIVPHPGTSNYWPLYDAPTNAAARLVIRYAKGAYLLYVGNTLVTIYEAAHQHSEATIVIAAVDPASGIGRVMFYDRLRYSRSFFINTSLPSFSGEMGHGYNGGNPDNSRIGDFEVLELDYWDTALSFIQMERAVSQMAALYKVGR